MDFCDTLSGFADFENTADHGLAENFVPDSGLLMSESVDRGYYKRSSDHFGRSSSVYCRNCGRNKQ